MTNLPQPGSPGAFHTSPHALPHSARPCTDACSMPKAASTQANGVNLTGDQAASRRIPRARKATGSATPSSGIPVRARRTDITQLTCAATTGTGGDRAATTVGSDENCKCRRRRWRSRSARLCAPDGINNMEPSVGLRTHVTTGIAPRERASPGSMIRTGHSDTAPTASTAKARSSEYYVIAIENRQGFLLTDGNIYDDQWSSRQRSRRSNEMAIEANWARSRANGIRAPLCAIPWLLFSHSVYTLIADPNALYAYLMRSDGINLEAQIVGRLLRRC